MRCSACGLYNPAYYQNCVSCGASLSEPVAVPVVQPSEAEDVKLANMLTKDAEPASSTDSYREAASRSMKQMRLGSPKFGRYPNLIGILVSVAIVLVSAGATVFFLTKTPDDQRLLRQGQAEIASGQYAFAVNTLTRVVSLRPNDAKVYLALARAYVGVDQVDKAWDCISHAQQLGTGVVAEPQLASDLANYYRQRGQYDRAIDLLRPLAKAEIVGKKAELADLDALWGDEALRKSDNELALRCWEEVRELKDGSRFNEAEPRLATIYQKLADQAVLDHDDDKALSYLAKLNYIAQNAKNYQLAANIYERDGQLDLAIDQVRQALKLSGHDPALEKQLTDLLLRRGKELLDAGNSEQGYAFLQQAKSFDPKASLPQVALRNLTVGLESGSKLPRLVGEVWNPGDTAVGAVTIKAELYDTTADKVLWSKENRLIDEFAPPLASQQSKSFDFLADVPVVANGLFEFKVYLDGTLYKNYPIGHREKQIVKDSDTASGATVNGKYQNEPDKATDLFKHTPSIDQSASDTQTKEAQTSSPSGLSESKSDGAKSDEMPTKPAVSPEEKTMKDLDY